MRKFNLYIGKYDWLVRVYIGAEERDIDEVVAMLAGAGCKGKSLKRARENLVNSASTTCRHCEGQSGRFGGGEELGDDGRRTAMNGGFTYSNERERVSVMSVGNGLSSKEFLDSLVHEIMHLSIHIARSEGVDLESEEVCYIGGDVAREMYDWVKDRLCCGCHEEVRKITKSM